MRITKEGVILTLKNIGLFLTSMAVADIQAEPTKFLYALLIYALVSVPSDLYLMNHVQSQEKKTDEV